MGGALAVAIRRKNGEEYISERWTNPLPHWMVNPLFWSGGKVIDEYITSEDNWKPVKRVFPSEYGTVLFDFKTKKVFSRQDYCGIGQYVCSDPDQKEARHLLAIIQRGWVTEYEVFRYPSDSKDKQTLHPDEVEGFHKYLTMFAKGGSTDPDLGKWLRGYHFKPGMVTMRWDVPGWTFERGNIDSKGKRQCTPRAYRCWSDVRAFMVENGWRSKSWSQEEVDRKFDLQSNTQRLV